ncbi:hypothetical protein T06_11758 [Trichinella sp. T6]|nr:hypothetical protein T06_11758 [Trichinella sp. T6]
MPKTRSTGSVQKKFTNKCFASSQFRKDLRI